MSITLPIPERARRHLEPVGAMYTMALQSFGFLVRDLVRGKFQWREFVERAWFLANTTVLQVILVSGPLGMAIVIQVGGLSHQLGADSYIGAADALVTRMPSQRTTATNDAPKQK